MSDKDTIYRQDAIDALRDARHRFTVADEAGGFGTVKWSEDVIYFAAADRVLSDLPSADRPKGEWVEDTYGWVYCSHCKKYLDDYQMVFFLKPFDYCPNCGSKMVRGDGEA